MNKSQLWTVKHIGGQIGNDLLIPTSLSADKYLFKEIERIEIVKPNKQVIERDAEFSIPFTRSSSYEWWILILNTQRDEVPIGSTIWVDKTLEEITRRNNQK